MPWVFVVETSVLRFVPSLLVEFCKRLNEDILSEINEMTLTF